MFELVMNHRAPLDEGRDEHRGHSNTETREVEARERLSFCWVWVLDPTRRRDVIVESTVFVVHDDKKRLRPRLGLPERPVHLGNQFFTMLHVVIRVLIRRKKRLVGRLAEVVVVPRLDETVRGQLVIVS